MTHAMSTTLLFALVTLSPLPSSFGNGGLKGCAASNGTGTRISSGQNSWSTKDLTSKSLAGQRGAHLAQSKEEAYATLANYCRWK